MRRYSVIILICALFVLSVLFFRCKILTRRAGEEKVGLYKCAIIKAFPFSVENSLKEWEEKIFKGKVIYKVETAENLSYVRAKSASAASALYYKIYLDAKKRRPIIRWLWRVEKFPVKKFAESLTTKNEDDFAGRVYVIFPTSFILHSRVLEYIWAETLTKGEIGTSPYSKNIKLMVLRSGPSKDWVYEERDIISDYLKAFGRLPDKNIGAVAFMTNTEHTETTADAMYDEVTLGYKDARSENLKEGKL